MPVEKSDRGSGLPALEGEARQSTSDQGVIAEPEGSATTPGSPTPPAQTGPRKTPWRLPNFSLVTKLAAMVLFTSLASAAIVAALGYLDGKEQLRQQALDQLSSIKSAKKQQVEWYFRQMRETFKSFGEDVTVVSAVSAFKDGFSQLGRQALAPERRQLLTKYYINEYIDDLTQSGEMPDLTSLLPKTDRALELQTLFIAENPNPKGERSKLADHPIGNAYTLTHYTFHPWFRDLTSRLHFYDLFLIDGISGDIVYSVSKEPEIGTSLLDGPYASTRLGQLVKSIIASPQRGTVFLADTSFYTPSGNVPAMFIATPIFANWKFMGVMAAQVNSDSLAAFMTNGGRWREDGLGDTGESYLAAEDRLMRSDSRGLMENKDAYLKDLEVVRHAQNRNRPDGAIEHDATAAGREHRGRTAGPAGYGWHCRIPGLSWPRCPRCVHTSRYPRPELGARRPAGYRGDPGAADAFCEAGDVCHSLARPCHPAAGNAACEALSQTDQHAVGRDREAQGR